MEPAGILGLAGAGVLAFLSLIVFCCRPDLMTNCLRGARFQHCLGEWQRTFQRSERGPGAEDEQEEQQLQQQQQQLEQQEENVLEELNVMLKDHKADAMAQ